MAATVSDTTNVYVTTVLGLAVAKCNEDKPIPGLDQKHLYNGNKAITGISVSAFTEQGNVTEVTKFIYPGFKNQRHHVISSYPPGHAWMPPGTGDKSKPKEPEGEEDKETSTSDGAGGQNLNNTDDDDKNDNDVVDLLPSSDFKVEMEDLLLQITPKESSSVSLTFLLYTWDDHSLPTFIHQLYSYNVQFPSNFARIRFVHMRGVMKSTNDKVSWPMIEMDMFRSTETGLPVHRIVTITEIMRMVHSLYISYAKLTYKEMKQGELIAAAKSKLDIKSSVDDNTREKERYQLLVDLILSRPNQMITLLTLREPPSLDLIHDINSRDYKLNNVVTIERASDSSSSVATVPVSSSLDPLTESFSFTYDPHVDHSTKSLRDRALDVIGLCQDDTPIETGFLQMSQLDIIKLQCAGIYTVGDLNKKKTSLVVQTMKLPLLSEFLRYY